MAITITIQNKPISFPESGTSPNWAPAVIAFAEAVEAALAGLTGGYDVAPQTQNIDAANPLTDIDITALSFPPVDVRAVTIYYAVTRQTDSAEVAEGGTIEMVYNGSNPNGNKWEIVNTHAGEAKIEFSVTDTGQLRYSTEAIAGINHTGKITFRAIAVLNS